MSPATKSKAARLADEGRVKYLIGAEVLAVQGDHACSHIRAAMQT